MVKTHTTTATFSRLGLMKIQVKTTIRRCIDIDKDFLNKLMKGIENEWINSFTIHAVDNNNL